MCIRDSPRQIPLKAAMGYMLTGRHIPAKRAFELGLVSEVVSREQLDETVQSYIDDILRCAPLSVRSTKETALGGLSTDLSEVSKLVFEQETRRRQSPDAIEGPRAFAEKRSPKWVGK